MIITAKNFIKEVKASYLPSAIHDSLQDLKDAISTGLYNEDREVKAVIDQVINKINIILQPARKPADNGQLHLFGSKKKEKDNGGFLASAVITVKRKPTLAAAAGEGYTAAEPTAQPTEEQQQPTTTQQQPATVQQPATTAQQPAPAPPVQRPQPKKPGSSSLITSLKGAKSASANIEPFKFRGDLSQFLGELEIKNTHSVVVTLDAPPGAGKTRSVFQMLNMAADAGYQSIFVSLEEHPMSKLFTDKATEYIAPQNEDYIDAMGELPPTYQEFKKIIEQYDVIAVDSWNKVFETYKGINFDKDLRKALDGKLIITIFQRTADGKMRGGSSSAFDGDVILEVVKKPDFRDSYLQARKNRYQDTPLNEIGYNFFRKELINPALEDDSEETLEIPQSATI